VSDAIPVDIDQALAFRLARTGLAAREATTLAEAAACPASDFARDAALQALAARIETIDRDTYDRAIDAGELVVAHIVRGAIHALDPADHALYGRALIAGDDKELAAQLGQQVKKLAAEKGFAPTTALDEVAAAIEDALAGGEKLDKNALHQAMRERVNPDYMPWCKGCGSHHVAPMLWRYATVKAGVRLDSQRNYVAGEPTGPPPDPAEALRRFLAFYGPSTPAAFADWAGVAKPHGKRVWAAVEDELTPVDLDGREAWILSADVEALTSPPAAQGIRLVPPGDPYLQKPNRPLLAPDDGLRKRLFRPVASPGAVLADGRLAGLWKARAKGKGLEVTVERIGGRRLARAGIEAEAERLAALRGATGARVTLD
jgi:hypothetical protein